MALTTKVSGPAQDAMVNALTALLNVGGAGFLDIYDATGTGQPAGPATAVTTQIKLAHLPLSATAFAASAAGTATAAAITTAAALATGTAAWFRATNNAGTGVIDGSVGTAGANLNLNSVAIQSGAAVSVSSWTVTEPAAGA